MKNIFVAIVACVFLAIACKNDSRLEIAMRMAGDNSLELMKVLDYYSKNEEDSLKLRAAIFLIENMPYHYTIESEKLSEYNSKLNFVFSDTLSLQQTRNMIDSICNSIINPTLGARVREDIKVIKADYLISSIDRAFDDWENGLWSKHLRFDDFCEYILPYRLGNESIEDWREQYSDKYKKSIIWVRDHDMRRNSAYWASLYLNDQIKKNGFHVIPFFQNSPVDHSPLLLLNMKYGSCKEYAFRTAFAMRACGIPVSVDFTPQWPYRSMNHTWNVVLDNNGKDIPFMGGESNPGYPNKPGSKYAKVFRYTFAYQKNSLFDVKSNEDVPPSLNSPFFRDVSESYFRGFDVDLKLPKNFKSTNKIGYLAVFDNQNWIPVFWSQINRRRLNFKHMGGGVVYMPVLYLNKKLSYFMNPVLVRENGLIQSLDPDTLNVNSVVLRRKFPKFSGVMGYSNRVVNAKIVGANRSDFKDSVVVGIINRNPLMQYDSIRLSEHKPFKYWKYISPENGYCNIAELQFFNIKNERVNSKARLIHYSEFTSGNKPENAIDGDGLSYYESRVASGGFLTFEFESPLSLSFVRYLPRNDDNNIEPGNTYELMYWNTDRWKSLGVHIAEADSLTYEGVPGNALLLLRNHTRGKEERVFTYENNTQVWW